MPNIHLDEHHLAMICREAGIDPYSPDPFELEVFIVGAAFCVEARERLLADLDRIAIALAVPQHLQQSGLISDVVDGAIARAVELRGGRHDPILDDVGDDKDHGDERQPPPTGAPRARTTGLSVWTLLRRPWLAVDPQPTPEPVVGKSATTIAAVSRGAL